MPSSADVQRLLKDIDTTYAGIGYSPHSLVEEILTGSCHQHVKDLVYQLFRTHLAGHARDLDQLITGSGLNPSSSHWVENTRNIAEQAAKIGFLDLARLSGIHEEVHTEIASILDPHIRAKAEREAAEATKQASPQSTLVPPVIIVGPGIGGPQPVPQPPLSPRKRTP